MGPSFSEKYFLIKMKKLKEESKGAGIGDLYRIKILNRF